MSIDEVTLMAWIAEWEIESVEFKQSLRLESKEGKGELVKDVIALANSASDTHDFIGYLIIGVSNERMIVGTDSIQEEQLQQIVRTYIHPTISLRCSTLVTQAPGWLQVGVIEIKGLDRPYSVARAIGTLQQGEVLVRRGSVVEKATKEEVIQMADQAESSSEVRRYVKSAEKHMELGNHAEAIESYNMALRAHPTAGLFLARGKARRILIDSRSFPHGEIQSVASQALNDLTNAVSMTDTFAVQKEARFERIRLYNASFVDYESRLEDFDWLKENTMGTEYGEVTCRDYWALDDNISITGSNPSEVIVAMDEVLQCGYSSAKVFELRAMSRFHLFDCNLALQDINTAIEKTKDIETQILYFSMRANILARMRRFEEAHDSFSTARRLEAKQTGQSFSDPLGYIASGLENEILWRYALEAKFGQLSTDYAAPVVSVLLQRMGAQRWIVPIKPFPELETKIESGVITVLRDYGLVRNELKQIVGEDFWDRWRAGAI